MAAPRFTSREVGICYRSPRPPSNYNWSTPSLSEEPICPTPTGTIRLGASAPCRNIRSGGTSRGMMLPIPSFPWLAAAANAFPWRPPMDANGWHHILAANMMELKKEMHDGSSPLVGNHTDGSSDGTDCVVCGDKSSGKHYGQFSCEGCKSFFKRSIRRSLSYTCRAAKNCAIDVQHRNQCQYCRLKKCIRMGMRKEGRRSHETQTAVSAVQRGRLPVQMPSFFPPNPFFRPFPFLPTPPIFNPLMAAQFAKPPVKESVYEFAAQTIFATVNWARTSMANLTKADQLLLLRHSWTPIFVFALAHSNFALNLASHLSESGSKTVETKKSDEKQNETTSEDFQSELDKVREYHLDIVEISSLRAILLFSFDGDQLEEKTKITEIVDKLEKALEEYCRMNKATDRFESLRECLRLLKTTRRLPISRIFFSRLLGATPLESILSDLLTMPPPTPQSLPLFPLPPRN